MKRSEVLFGLLRIPLDMLGVMAALLLSHRLRLERIDLIPGVQLLEPSQTLPTMQTYLESFVVPSMGIFIVIAAFLGLYALRTTRSAWSEMTLIIITSLLWLVAVIAWFFLIRKELFYSRILLLHASVFMMLFVLMARTAVVLLQRAFLRLGMGVRYVVSIGKQPLAGMARRILKQDPRYQYCGHSESLSALKNQLNELPIDLVIQTDAHPASGDTINLINECRSRHVGYAFLPPVLTDVPHMLEVQRLGLLPMMYFKPTPLDGWGRVFKRLFDIVVSLALLIILSPILVLIALLVILTSGFPIIYVSKRIGQHGKGFIPMLKFRSMVKNADQVKEELRQKNERQDGPLFKMKNDPRITWFGSLLRRFDLDELPQLFNVLIGDMSLVGPRPHLPEEVDRYANVERRVFAVKPGITGLSQISGRSTLNFEQEVRFDLQYIEEWSLWLDLWILWRTVFVVLKSKVE